MFIKEIKNYDVEAQEADIVVSDGKNSILCYAHPFKIKENIIFSLYAFGAKEIMKVNKNSYLIEKLDESYYAYHFRGKIIDIKNKLTIILINDIQLEMDDYIPNDLTINDFIEFSILRIDLLTNDE